jgi:protein gp37
MAKAGGPPILIGSELEAPLRRKKPARIGVQFMGDLFHKDVPFEFIDKVFAIMALCPQHTFQVLTKRSERQTEYVLTREEQVSDEVWTMSFRIDRPSGEATRNAVWLRRFPKWPPPNIWLGTSVENQAAVHRIEHLLRCPAALRFLSLEPLLGPIVLPSLGYTGPQTMVDWCIVGGESGPGARPMHPDWVRSIRDQCKAADVPFFFKGWGDWLHDSQIPDLKWLELQMTCAVHDWPDGSKSYRVGKTKAGDLLDGQRHQAWPKGA